MAVSPSPFAAGSYLGFDTTYATFSRLYAPLVINGSMGVRVMGGGSNAVLMGGANGYTGGTLITSGTLRAEKHPALGTGTVEIDGGTLEMDGSNLSINNLTGSGGYIGIYPASNVTNTLTTTVTGTSTYAGAIVNQTTGSFHGTVAITKAGTGTLILTSLTNSYSGLTTVNNGTLELAGTHTVPMYASGSTYLSVATGATLAVEVGGTGQWIGANIDSLLGSSGAFASGSYLGIDTTGGNATYTPASPISLSIGLVKLGANALTLGNANSYNGGTTVSGGTLQLGDDSAMGTGPVAITAATAVLDLFGYNPTVGALSGTAGSTITNTYAGPSALTTSFSSGTSTFAGTINDGAGTVSLTKGDSGTLVLTNANTYSGGTTLNGGVLVVGRTRPQARRCHLERRHLGQRNRQRDDLGQRDRRRQRHTIAPGGIGTIGQFNIGGLDTSNLTTLNFDLTTPGGSGDLIVIGSNGLSVSPSTTISFGVNPTIAGDYRLIGGTIGTPTLADFLLRRPREAIPIHCPSVTRAISTSW